MSSGRIPTRASWLTTSSLTCERTVKRVAPPFAQTSDGILDRLAVDPGVKEHPPFGVDEEITGHGDGHARARGMVREKDVTVKLQKAATQGIDLSHRSPPW
jgi:hypothetical protein